MNAIDRIIDLGPDDVSHADLVKAVLEVAANLDDIKQQIASGRAGAKVTEIEPERLAETSGES